MSESKSLVVPNEEKCKQLDAEDGVNATLMEDEIAKEKEKNEHFAVNGIGKKEVQWYLRAAVFVLAVLLVVFLIALLILVVAWRDKRTNALQSREQDVCVHRNRLHNCTGELTQQDTLCCGKTSIVASSLVKQFSSEKFKDSAGARMLSESCENAVEAGMQAKHVAKLVGLDMSKITQQGEGTVVFWDDGSADNIVRGVEYNNGCFKIKRTGHYFLYSQVKLSRNREQAMLPGNGPFSLSMHRYRNSREKLLESSNSECDISSSEDVTSSIGAVFELEEGDAISVETSHPQNLVDSRESNYFGLYSI